MIFDQQSNIGVISDLTELLATKCCDQGWKWGDGYNSSWDQAVNWQFNEVISKLINQQIERWKEIVDRIND